MDAKISKLLSIQNQKNIQDTRTKVCSNSQLERQPHKDTFCKNKNINFKGNNDDTDIFSVPLDTIFNYLDEILFDAVITKAIEEIYAEVKQNIFTECMIEAFNNSSKDNPDININMRNFEEPFSSAANKVDASAEQLFAVMEEGGLTQSLDFAKFTDVYCNSEDVQKHFEFRCEDAIKIYGALDNKKHFAQYPELLAHLVEKDEEGHITNKDELNQACNYLSDIGVDNFNDFPQRFDFLKNDFENFETTANKADALDYLMKNHELKILLVEEMLENKKSKYNVQDLYRQQGRYIDLAFENVQGEGIDDFEEYFDYIINKPKLFVKNALAKEFNNFSDIQDEFNMFKFLKSHNVSSKDAQQYFGIDIITDDKKTELISNQNAIVQIISSEKGIKPQEAEKYYLTNPQIFNAIYNKNNSNEADDEIDLFKSAFTMLDTFKINTPSKFINFYKQLNKKQTNKISQEEAIDFIKTFAFLNKDDNTKNAQLVYKNLKERRNLWEEKYKGEISEFSEKFPQSFIGMNSFTIFHEFSKSLLSNPKRKTEDILTSISILNAQNSTQLQNRKTELDRFKKFFPTEKDAIQFINKNQISFDNDEASMNYREGCINALQIITKFARKNKQKWSAEELINNLSASNFLKNSKDTIISQGSQERYQSTFANIIIAASTKKIPSTHVFEGFLNKYKDENGNCENVLKALLSCKDDVNFQSFSENITRAQQAISDLNIPIKIDNSNIRQLNFDTISKENYDTQDINEIICSLLGAKEDTSFISLLPNAFGDKEQKYITRYRIANELLSHKDKDNSYKKLIEALIKDKSNIMKNNQLPEEYKIKNIAKEIPQEFIDFINSNDWCDICTQKDKAPVLGVHQKLRLISRFGLDNGIEELYSEKTKEELKNILKAIYYQTPTTITKTSANSKIATNIEYNGKTIEAIFTGSGTLVTLYPKFEN